LEQARDEAKLSSLGSRNGLGNAHKAYADLVGGAPDDLYGAPDPVGVDVQQELLRHLVRVRNLQQNTSFGRVPHHAVINLRSMMDDNAARLQGSHARCAAAFFHLDLLTAANSLPDFDDYDTACS
jgi:hypothetical protein